MRIYSPPEREDRTVEEKRVQTVVDVEAGLRKLREWLKGMTPVKEFTIEDYPISRTARGRCKLEVEYKKNEWRKVRTTTDKRGRWCKPHKETYDAGVGLVVLHPQIEAAGKGAAWLAASVERGVFVVYANYEGLALAKPPCCGLPQRTEHRYSIIVQTMMIGQDAAPKREEKPQVIPADPPELCDAYDLWEREARVIVAVLIALGNGLKKAV